MARVRVSRVIDASAAEVWALVADIGGHANWQVDVRSIEFTSAKHRGVGATYLVDTRLGPIRSFGVISFITSLLLLPLTLAFGKIETPLRVEAGVNLILIVSAVTCISLAHVLYYVAIRKVGVALSQTLQLICPAGALGLSAFFFGEHLTQAQLWSAGLLLFGAFLAMRVKPAADPTALEEV